MALIEGGWPERSLRPAAIKNLDERADARRQASSMEHRKSQMKIDLRIIRQWVQKWQINDGINRTASQLAAVMLSTVLEQSEKRLARTEAMMSGLLAESLALQKMERDLIDRLKSKRGLDAEVDEQLKAHRRRMRALLKEADEVMKAPSADQSIIIGGLLFEINSNASSVKTLATD
jgi:hypothetical protein